MMDHSFRNLALSLTPVAGYMQRPSIMLSSIMDMHLRGRVMNNMSSV